MRIKLDKGKRFRGQSIFVKVGTDELDCLDVIKSFKCYYHKTNNMWELPKVAFKTILDKCSMCNITIHGELPKEFEQYLELIEKYDQGAADKVDPGV